MPRIINHSDSNLSNDSQIKHTHSFKTKYSQNLPLQFFSYKASVVQPMSPPSNGSSLPSWMHNNSRPRTKPHSRGRAQWAVGKDSKRKAIETGWVDLFPLSSSASMSPNTLGFFSNNNSNENSSNIHNHDDNDNNNENSFASNFSTLDHHSGQFYPSNHAHTHFGKNNSNRSNFCEYNHNHFGDEVNEMERERETHFEDTDYRRVRVSPSSSQPTSPENEVLPNISELIANSFPVYKGEKRSRSQSPSGLPSLSKYHYTPTKEPTANTTSSSNHTAPFLQPSGSPLDLLCECALETGQERKKPITATSTTTTPSSTTTPTIPPVTTSFKSSSHSLPPLPQRLADVIKVIEVGLKQSTNIDQLMDFVITETKLTPPIIYKILFDHFGLKFKLPTSH